MYHLSKTATISGEYTWIDAQDPAFDREATGMDPEAFFLAVEEALEANDMARIQSWLRPNEKPTRWKLRHLSDDASRYLSDELQSKSAGDTISAQVLKDAASLALCGVDDLPGPDGAPIKVQQNHRHPRCGLPCVAPKTMALLAQLDSGGCVTRIGFRALRVRTPQGNS